MLSKTNATVTIGGGGGEAQTLRVKNKTGEKIVKGQKLYIRNQCYEQLQHNEFPGTYYNNKMFLWENGRYFCDGESLYEISDDLSVHKVKSQELESGDMSDFSYIVHDKYGNICLNSGLDGYKPCVFLANSLAPIDFGTGVFTADGGYIINSDGLVQLNGKDKKNGDILTFSPSSKDEHIVIDDYIFSLYKYNYNSGICGKLNFEEKKVEEITASASLRSNDSLFGVTLDNRYLIYRHYDDKVKYSEIALVKYIDGNIYDCDVSELKELSIYYDNITSMWYDGHNGILTLVNDNKNIHVFKYDIGLHDFVEVPFFIDTTGKENIMAPHISADFSIAVTRFNINKSNQPFQVYRLSHEDGYIATTYERVGLPESIITGYAAADCEANEFVDATILYPNTSTDVTFNINTDATLTVE